MVITTSSAVLQHCHVQACLPEICQRNLTMITLTNDIQSPFCIHCMYFV